MQDASFFDANLRQDAGFSKATFSQKANLSGATFTQVADFQEATFMQDADFFRATFTQDANFWKATFTQNADFADTIFYGTANWSESFFLDRAEFRRTEFKPRETKPSAVFALASFSKPGKIMFADVDLSRALFHNCDASQVWFTSSVRWGSRKGDRGAMVFEETIPLDERHAVGLRDVFGKRDYGAVAQLYQQLKKNYDVRLDYWTANEFHYGEMEMQRLAVKAGGFAGLRRWWHPRMSLVAWYRLASDYGNSYVKPLWWLLLTLLVAAAMFPLPRAGLQRGVSGAPAIRETYGTVWSSRNSVKDRVWAEGKLLGRSWLAAVDTATFQKSPEYAPAYPWGRVMAIIEALLTSTLFALFLLAIRRQFRR